MKNIILSSILLVFIIIFIGNVLPLNESTTEINQTTCSDISFDKACINISNSYFIHQLNISNETDIDVELLIRLEERKKEDSNNINNIISLSRYVKEDLRLRAVEEILSINNRFIERFYTTINTNSQTSNNVASKDILGEYMGDIVKGNKFKIELSDDRVRQLFSDNNSSSFVDSLKVFK